jgi:hypothetical protein
VEGTARHSGGAISARSGAMVDLPNRTLVRNRASGSAGTVWCQESASLLVRNSVVWDNGSSPVYCEEFDPTIT